jgi:hypothetical protein
VLLIVAGMPRSASTLQSNIAKFILENSNIGEREEWSIDWQKDLINSQKMIEDEKVYLLKTHWVTDDVLKLAARYPDKVSFLISYRDIRDVAVSMMVKFDYSFDKAVNRIELAIQNIERIRLTGCRVLEQTYHTLRYELESAVMDVNEFLLAGLSADLLEKVVSELDIEKAYIKSRLKKIPFEGVRRKLAFLFKTKFPYADSEMMLHANHVSEHKGETGVWKNKLNQEQVTILEKQFADWLRA